MKCYAIYHHSSCSCRSCDEDNEFNSNLFFNDDDIIEAIEENPHPSQFSDKGRHTIHSFECEKSDDGNRLIFREDQITIEIDISGREPDDTSRLYISQYKFIDLLCATISNKTYTINADEKPINGWFKYE